MVSYDFCAGMAFKVKILLTGGTGMVGSAFKKVETKHTLVHVGSRQYDLTSADDTWDMFENERPDAVIHLAAKVGGVKGNTDYIADFFFDNIKINANVLQAACDFKVPKVVSLLSTCIYPDNPTYPLTENQIHNGEPHKSNFGYAYAKRMLDVQSRAIRQQYGMKYVTVVPNNIYGINDNFDLENGHIVPAIIRKIHEAKLNNSRPVFWGTGKALREFTYSVDIARLLLWAVDNYESSSPLNIGNPDEVSIRDLVSTVQRIMNCKANVLWDDKMPEGQMKKPSSNKNFRQLNPTFEYSSLRFGLEETIAWFLKEYPNVRGV